MSPATAPDSAAIIEQCVDELDELIASLEHYPQAVVALALRIQLAALLRAMLDERLCTREDAHGLLADLSREVLGGESA